MTKKDKLLNEQTIRRWAKLADLSVINENFFEEEEAETTDTEDTVTEEEATDEETVVAEEEGEEEGDMEVDMEAGEAEDAEGMDVVQAVLAALEPFGVEVDEDDAGEEAGEEMEMGAGEDAAMAHGDKDPAMDHGMKDPAMDHGMGDYGNRQDETLDLEVVDDEALTEAVLKRVLKRILSNKSSNPLHFVIWNVRCRPG